VSPSTAWSGSLLQAGSSQSQVLSRRHFWLLEWQVLHQCSTVRDLPSSFPQQGGLVSLAAAARSCTLLLEKWPGSRLGTLYLLVTQAGYDRPAACPLLTGSDLTFSPKTEEMTSLELEAEICVKAYQLGTPLSSSLQN